MEYRPPYLLRNGHLNTIYASLFRKQEDPGFSRKRITTRDDDFLDVDCLLSANKRLAILCHGLEGNSSSSYIKGLSRILHNNGWDVAAMNFRACSGEINKQKIMYHSGATDDLDAVYLNLHAPYTEVVLIGFSLGGNLVLKYCGERGHRLDSKIRNVVAVSVPLDLAAGSKHIGRPVNYLYEKRFLLSLTKKIKEKHKQFPDHIDLSLLKRATSLFDFDDVFTAPMHGFKDADDYYRQCSAKQYIRDIQVPGMIINAVDDPFLPEACYPFEAVAQSKSLQMLTPKFGGHVGFVQFGQKYYWSEKAILDYLNTHFS